MDHWTSQWRSILMRDDCVGWLWALSFRSEAESLNWAMTLYEPHSFSSLFFHFPFFILFFFSYSLFLHFFIFFFFYPFPSSSRFTLHNCSTRTFVQNFSCFTEYCPIQFRCSMATGKALMAWWCVENDTVAPSYTGPTRNIIPSVMEAVFFSHEWAFFCFIYRL